MSFAILFISLFSLFQEVPMKPNEEFELILDFQFKPRPQSQTVHLGVGAKSSNSPLPYLAMQLNVLKVQGDEHRVKVEDFRNNVLANKLLAKSTSVKFELGFTDDLKDHVTAHKYFIKFYGPDKKVKRNIIILFEKDGTYSVNSEVRGKI